MRFRMVFTAGYSGGDNVNTASHITPPSASPAAELVGRVTSISGGQAKISLTASVGVRAIDSQPTVGRFLGIQSGAALIIVMISAVEQEPGPGGSDGRSVARVELIGE